MRRGSLVKMKGKCRGIPHGKFLEVHAVKGDKVVVWVMVKEGTWSKRTVSTIELEVVVE